MNTTITNEKKFMGAMRGLAGNNTIELEDLLYEYKMAADHELAECVLFFGAPAGFVMASLGLDVAVLRPENSLKWFDAQRNEVASFVVEPGFFGFSVRLLRNGRWEGVNFKENCEPTRCTPSGCVDPESANGENALQLFMVRFRQTIGKISPHTCLGIGDRKRRNAQ